MSTQKILQAIYIFLSFAACGKNELPDYFKVDHLEVLALLSSQSEVDISSGAATVTITPLVTDTQGAGRTLTYTLEACHDFGVSLGATPSCDNDPLKQSQTGTFTLPSPHYTGTHSPSTAITIPITAWTFPYAKTETEKYNGVPFIILYKVNAADGESITAFRRIIAATQSPLNSIPTLTAIQSSEVTITALPETSLALKPVISGEPEPYFFKNSAGTRIPRTETFTVTWFVNHGALERSRTDLRSENTWKGASDSEGTRFLIAILRDNRGGVSYISVGL